MNDLRKLLLLFKLYHGDPLPEIDIGLDGRDKELCKPTIQLFYGTESQREIEETLQHFIDVKNERKKQSLEATIYPIVVNAVSELGVKIPSKKMWDLITTSLEGEFDNNSQYTFNTSDHKIYINTVTKIICDKFGAESKHERQGNVLIFNEKDLAKSGKLYSGSNTIETKLVEDCEPCEGCEASWRDQKPFYMLEDSEKSIANTDLIDNLQLDEQEINDNTDADEKTDPVSASRASHPSQEKEPIEQCPVCKELGHPYYISRHNHEEGIDSGN